MSNHEIVYKNLALALNGHKNSLTEGAEALKTVAFIERVYREIHLQT